LGTATGAEARVASIGAGGGARGGAPIEDRAALAAFLGEEAEAFARDAVDGYTRARVRGDPDATLTQRELADAVARARGEAFPIALILVGQTVEGALAPHAQNRPAELDGLIDAALAAFDRHPRPAAMTIPAWAAARGELSRWLAEAAGYPPKSTNVIADPFVGPMLALMPIHDALGRDDYPLLRNTMHTALAAVHARFTAHAVAPLLIGSLARRDS
jgi:hypothetical protein